MLVITRKPGESVWIGDVEIRFFEARGSNSKVGINAPADVRILRGELKDRDTKRELERESEV